MKSNDEEKNIEYTYAKLNKIKKLNNVLYEKIKDKKGIILRITKIRIDNKKEEYLISNLSKEDFTEEDFTEEDLKEIYEKDGK